MKCTMDLSGIWKLALDKKKQGLPASFNDTICLPDTTSHAGKGPENTAKETGCLTDTRLFEGYAWYQKEITIPEELSGLPAFFSMERTRKTTLYLDGRMLGSECSLSAPHRYELTGLLTPGVHTITVLVDNTDYPTRGGHLTSPDTQTNWNGITGEIRLDFYPLVYVSDLSLRTDIQACTVTVSGTLHGTKQAEALVSILPNVPSGAVLSFFDALRSPLGAARPKITDLYPASMLFHGPAPTFSHQLEEIFPDTSFPEDILPFDPDITEDWLPEMTVDIGTNFSVSYELSDEADFWSEYTPVLHALHFQVGCDVHTLFFGLREFKSAGDKFEINGAAAFLRGKHDGLIFPLTGAAPATAAEWLKVMGTVKSYGINHYRFHTCCPPEAAFLAADLLGIYMEPELPFWGTLVAPGDTEYHKEEQDFLIREGERMLKAYGNHPSFVMLSLGNELWGSTEQMGKILRHYKGLDSSRLYTQGSNNFQWTPVILSEDDFFCGVRLSVERQLRGSYAMCDAPLGHVQTAEPSTMTDYDAAIHPWAETKKGTADASESANGHSDTDIEIQYGTGIKRVKAAEAASALIPQIPVIAHEAGQYETFVNFKEIDKYTGSVKARNFEIFRDRLREKGMLSLAGDFFKNSGRLAMSCYKEELESFFRSRRMAGFQLLDLQDFSGQGTALVGVLDAFLDSKGLISPEEWRTFCSDTVLLARFPKFNYLCTERFTAHIELACFQPENPGGECLLLSLGEQQMTVPVPPMEGNYVDICDISLPLPNVDVMTELNFELQIQNTGIRKGYSIWVYPEQPFPSLSHPLISTNWAETKKRLSRKETVLYLPAMSELSNSLPGFYCTDFWCYPMFRSISEEMNKAVPVGTMGLNIHNKHKSLRGFPCRTYSTKPWWNLIEHSRALILDGLPKDYFPVVQTIDNFERNHKLGTLLECRCSEGRLFICTIDFPAISDKPEAGQLLSSILKYVGSEEFQPKDTLTADELEPLFS